MLYTNSLLVLRYGLSYCDLPGGCDSHKPIYQVAYPDPAESKLSCLGVKFLIRIARFQLPLYSKRMGQLCYTGGYYRGR